MSKMQIVFLFDLNAFNDEPGESARDLQRQLMCLRVSCLRILTHYSTLVPNLKWGFKFFDSNGSLTQTMQNFNFPHVSLENFEIFENEICTKYQRHISYLEALVAAANQNTTILNEDDPYLCANKKVTHPIQIMHLALTQILYEYQWNDCVDMFSPSTKKRTHYATHNKKNLLFFISKCPSNDAQFQKYFDVECVSLNASKFTNILLSSSLHKQLLDKASILWIWLNTLENTNFLGNSKPSSIMIIASTLKSMKCSLIPLSVLSKPNSILKLRRKHNAQDAEFSQTGVSSSPMVPFSSTLLHSVSYPFYLERQAPSNEAEIQVHFPQEDVKILVSVTQVPLLWNRERNCSSDDSNATQKDTKPSSQKSSTICWNKFTLHFLVPKHIQSNTNEMLLLLPRVSDDLSSFHNLKDLIKSLTMKNLNLFITCETMSGFVAPAVLNPISESSAIISILDTKTGFLSMPEIENGQSSANLNLSKIKDYLALKAYSNPINENSDVKLSANCSEVSSLQPFQMECIEPWFETSLSASSALQDTHKSQQCPFNMQSFHDNLQKFYKKFKNQKKDTSEIIQSDFAETRSSNKTENLEDIEKLYKDVTYDELISILNQTYENALKSTGDVLHSAKKIIKLSSSFFLKKSIISYEESMKNFMFEYFLLTCRKVIEKYKSNLDEDASVQKINECQLQAILALEMEVLFPSADYSICANTVRSFLGVLSFNSTPTEHNKFLCEVLKENYSHNLYDILLEIGDELMMPEEDSVDSGNEDQIFGTMSDPLESVMSSNLSVKSTSSTSSRGENRKLIKKRSDISETNKSRQVLLPGKSPKRKKAKNSFMPEKNAIRYSPRLASKKKRNKFKTVDSKPETARRNLFPKDRKPHTPRTSSVRTPKKKKALTPKTHHVLKTNFVPETPSYKQNQSALQRRKSQMDITSPKLEIAESPVISKNSQGTNILNRLQKLKEERMVSASQQEPVASCSFQSRHTPETKRRLSLQLFSKVLTSPTARMGLKKCSKRLFDQISPRVFGLPPKKMKLEESVEKENVTQCTQEARTPKKCHVNRNDLGSN